MGEGEKEGDFDLGAVDDLGLFHDGDCLEGDHQRSALFRLAIKFVIHFGDFGHFDGFFGFDLEQLFDLLLLLLLVLLWHFVCFQGRLAFSTAS